MMVKCKPVLMLQYANSVLVKVWVVHTHRHTILTAIFQVILG